MTIRLLRGISVGYLLLPNLLFFIYWTRPFVALSGIVLLLYLFLQLLRGKTNAEGTTLNARDGVSIGMLALFLTLLSGTAGICFQSLDQWAHNIKFYDLFLHEWPLRYPATGPAYSYYFGYYLVPALYSRIIGSISPTAILFWTCLGLGLGIAWLYLLLNKKILYVLLCLCLGDFPSILLKALKRMGVETSLNYGYVEIRIYPISKIILWVPNQVIPTILIGGMLAYMLKNRVAIEEIVFPITLSFWWAVFPAFAFGLIAGVLLVRKWILARFKLNWWEETRQVILPVLACLPVLILYESHRKIISSGFIWEFGLTVNNYINYGLEVMLELLLSLLVYRRISQQTSDMPAFPFYLILVLMLIIPVYRIGMYMDFQHYSILPYLLIVGLYLLEPLSAERSYLAVVRVGRQSFFNFILLALLFSSSYTTWLVIKNALNVNIVTSKLNPGKSTNFKPYPYNAYPTIYDFLKKEFSQEGANEYLGKKGSIYEEYISRKD